MHGIFYITQANHTSKCSLFLINEVYLWTNHFHTMYRDVCIYRYHHCYILSLNIIYIILNPQLYPNRYVLPAIKRVFTYLFFTWKRYEFLLQILLILLFCKFRNQLVIKFLKNLFFFPRKVHFWYAAYYGIPLSVHLSVRPSVHRQHVEH